MEERAGLAGTNARRSTRTREGGGRSEWKQLGKAECHNWSGRVRPPQDNRLVRVQIINAAFPSLYRFFPILAVLPFLPSLVRDARSRGSHVLPRVSRFRLILIEKSRNASIAKGLRRIFEGFIENFFFSVLCTARIYENNFR